MASEEFRRRNRSRSPRRRNGNRDNRPEERHRESKGRHYSGKSRPLDMRNEVSQSASRSHREDTMREEISSSRERRKGRDRQRYESPARERPSHNRTEGSVHSAGSMSEEDSRRESNLQEEGPNYNLSGKLTEYTNTYKGVVIKYNEPPEARKPKTRWRLYPFKGDQAMSVMYIHRQSAYLIGRQRHIVDISVDHPSCSKQHAVLQYRLVDYERPDGTASKKVKPYIIDLDSINGTFLNNQKIEPRRYYELKEKDVLKFGFSTREYVVLTEKSQDVKDEDDEDETQS